MKTRSSFSNRLACVALFFLLPGAWGIMAAETVASSLRVALVSDLHVTRGTREEQPFHIGRLERAITAVNTEKVDLVLIAGDMTENGTRKEFADLRSLLSRFHAPVWCVPGNHDLGGKIVPKNRSTKDITPDRLVAYEWRLGPSWFARELAGVRVLGLNGSLLGSGFPQEAAMWQMLEQQLAEPSSRPTLLLSHYPLFTKQSDEPGGVYWNVEPGPRHRLLALVRKGGVRAVLSGHLHTENMARRDGVLYVTTAPVAFGIPKNRQYRGWTLLTVPPQGEVTAEFRYQMD